MLLGEPPRTPYDLTFALFGIPVRVHPLFWLVSLILGANGRDGVGILIWIVAVFFSILVHELGHAWMMQAYGFRPWICLHGMGGVTSCDPRSGFGPRRYDALRDVLISAAGPIAGFLLAALLLAIVVAAGHGDQIERGGLWGLLPVVRLHNSRLALLLHDVLFICIFWGLVNLLPIYPLDGGQIAREVFLRFHPGDGIRQSMLLSIFAATAMALYGFVQLRDSYMGLFFCYLAYNSFIALQNYSGRSPW